MSSIVQTSQRVHHVASSTVSVSVGRGRQQPNGWLLSDVMLGAFMLGLMTQANYLGISTVGPVPVSLIILPFLLLSYASSVARALSASVILQLFTLGWLAWCAVTLARLSVDYPVYQQLALRDSVITWCFAAVLLGAAVVERHGDAVVAWFASRGLWLVAAYVTLALVNRSAGTPIPEIGAQNVGSASLALFAASLWSRSLWARFVLLGIGTSGVLIEQSRMGLLMAVVIVSVFVLTQQRGSGVTSGRLGRILTVIVGGTLGVLVLSAATRQLQIQGRLGAVSGDFVIRLFGSVFDDSSQLSGSRQLREVWWEKIVLDLRDEPSALITGMGLGRDLALGFRSADGVLIRKPHNDFLETLAREGFFALLPLAAVIVAGLVALVILLRRDKLWAFSAGWAIASVGFCLAQPYLSYPYGAIPLAVILGAGIRAAQGYAPGTPLMATDR